MSIIPICALVMIRTHREQIRVLNVGSDDPDFDLELINTFRGNLNRLR